MANVKISALPAATTPLAGTEALPIVQSGVTAKVSIANLTAGRSISASDLTLTNALPIASGGTGQITANASFNALAPSQTSNSGKYLTTDGSNTSWATNPLGTVTSITAGTGLTGGTITTSGTIAIDTTVVATLTGTQTLTNKTISGANNTLSNIGNASLTNSAITINGTSTSLGGSINVGTVTSVAALTLGTSGTDLSSTVATGTTTPVITLNVPTASATNRGVLSSADWTTFNNKGSGTVTSVTGTAPVVSSGGVTPAISMAAATTSVNGYLTSTDWTTFNNKQAALVSGTNLKTVNGTTLLGSGDLGIITGTYGGTGINNGSNTITIAGNLTHAGAFTQSYTATANTAVTLPAGATAASNNLLSSATAVGIVTGTPSASNYLRGDGTWATIASGGTVSSVALTAPSIFTVTGSPITSSGTLALTYSGTALPILNGGTGQTTASAAFNALSPITTAGDLILGTGVNTAGRLGIGTNGQVLQSNGTTASWVTFTGGATITATTSNTTYYLVGTSSTSGSLSTASISTTSPVSYNASTGTLSAPVHYASEGFYTNSLTNTVSYTIPATANAMTVGPYTIASSTTVTVSSGSRWVII